MAYSKATLAIDPPGTKVREDAIRASSHDGKWFLRVHVTDAARGIAVRSNEDNRARNVVTDAVASIGNHGPQVYPASLLNALALGPRDHTRVIAVSAAYTLDGDGAGVVLSAQELGGMYVVDYRQAELALHQHIAGAWHKILIAASDLAHMLRRRWGVAEGGPETVADIVTDMMRAANAAAGSWAVENGVPLLFLNRSGAACESSRLSVTPVGHDTVGGAPYARVTSPLRRYDDLINQRSITAHLAGRPAPYSLQELNDLAAAMNRAHRPGVVRGPAT